MWAVGAATMQEDLLPFDGAPVVKRCVCTKRARAKGVLLVLRGIARMPLDKGIVRVPHENHARCLT